jgi:hypothetical protein
MRRGEWRHSSKHLTSAIYGGELFDSLPGRFILGEGIVLVSIEQDFGWAPDPAWKRRRSKLWRRETPCPFRKSNHDSPFVQPVNCEIPAATDLSFPSVPMLLPVFIINKEI